MEAFSTVEWRIENFTCWRERLHGKCIASPTLLSVFFREQGNISLYPRGHSGHDSHLAVRSTHVESDFYGDLSFVGPDGALLCTQRVAKVTSDDPLELPPGPLYQDVIAHVKKHEDVYGDRLVLRFRFRSDAAASSERNVMSTSIDVERGWWRVDPGSVAVKNVLHFEDVMLQVRIKGDDGPVELALDPMVANKKFAVETSVSFLNGDQVVRNEHLFADDDAPWTFADSLTMNVLVLGLKVIKGSISSRQEYDILDCRGVSAVPNESSSCLFPDDPRAVLTKDISSLHTDREFTDFELKCDTTSFLVHRAILSARSPVLKSMLSDATPPFEIPDMDPSTLASFLSYLYTGTVEDLQHEDTALKLYYAADKYQVPTLKKACLDQLVTSLSLSNVCDVLSLGDRHQDEGLVMVCCNFIMNKYVEVLKSKEWETFIEKEPLRAVKFLSLISQRKTDTCDPDI